MKEILDNVLGSIKPTKEEEKEVFDKVDFILKKINNSIRDAKAILGGSGIKGTWLKNAHDEDIFVCFDYTKYKNRSDELSDILEKKIKKKFKIKRLHGSRDYFQIKDKGSTVEIIPILGIKKADDAKNITDISPLHALWVNKHKKLRDEMRLLKHFCKSNDLYGAESHIKGFSGYICEILVVNYGSFVNVLKSAVKWKEKDVIDVRKYFKKGEVFRTLNSSKLFSPLIVIDPVQESRNAAAALSYEKFELFKKKAKEFLKKPSIKFFEKKEFSIEDIKKKAKKNLLIVFDVKPNSGKEDIVGCKLIKALETIRKGIEKEDFKIINYGWNWNKDAIFYFIIKKEKLSKMKIHDGPPLRAKDHVKIFKKMYKKTFVDCGIVKAEIKRKYTDVNELVKDLIKDKDVKSRVKKIKIR